MTPNGNRTHDLPACSAVPQPTAPPAACPGGSIASFSGTVTLIAWRLPWFNQFYRHTHSLLYGFICSVLQAYTFFTVCLHLFSSTGINILYCMASFVQFYRHTHSLLYGFICSFLQAYSLLLSPISSSQFTTHSRHAIAHSKVENTLLVTGRTSLNKPKTKLSSL